MTAQGDPAVPFHDTEVPHPTQVRSDVEEMDLNELASAASGVSDTEGPVEILTEMDEGLEYLLILRPWGLRIGEHLFETLHLTDNPSAGRAEAGIVTHLRKRHVDIVPWTAPGHFALLTGPSGGIRQALAEFQKAADGGRFP